MLIDKKGTMHERELKNQAPSYGENKLFLK